MRAWGRKGWASMGEGVGADGVWCQARCPEMEVIDIAGNDRLSDSSVEVMTRTHSLTHSLTQPLTHSLTHPTTHSLTHPPTHSLNHPCAVRGSQLSEIAEVALALVAPTHRQGNAPSHHTHPLGVILEPEPPPGYDIGI